ncbi:hypothetical protein GCM10007079_33080 [Nocardiopsis terrae]|uniref:Uncharacterized protein n=1 Tax=Nocardiopsis terrae TaxID=372655 RepID=A0ABR9HJD2_9ACTN|nr:hypothetical protein [Nocardiopsis terrae]MBE1459123.1 hypothetical protein [Nocardiopsis terrae]GHC88265.1 hypothetical protein GCM10007079_33080 [Nocardiopsis terrae]
MKLETAYTGTHEKDESEDNTTNVIGKCGCGCGESAGWCNGSV